MTTIDLEYIKGLKLEPGDVLVIKAERAISQEQIQRLRDSLSSVFTDNQVAFLAPGVELDVIRLAPLAPCESCGHPRLAGTPHSCMDARAEMLAAAQETYGPGWPD
jgi:hypothetical protein